MSVFNALSTAVSGINAQSTAFTNLSNNIANSQTVGYKADSTAFQDFVAGSLSGAAFAEGVSDSVAAVTVQHVDNQGTASSSTDTLALTISGSGLFDVSKETGATSSGTTQFQDQQYYTRNGEFYENNAGYLVNTAGYYLDGYMVDPTTSTLGTTLTQINVANVAFRPTQTTTLTATGSLSASAGAVTTDATAVYDGSYNQNAPKDSTMDTTLTWTPQATATAGTSDGSTTWTVTASGTGTGSVTSDTYYVNFDSSGALESVTDSTGTVNYSSTLSGAKVTLPITVTYGDGTAQTVNLSLGTIGGTSGMTVSSTATTNTVSTASDSVTSGNFTGVSIESDGSVMASFDNGDTQLIGKVALSNFANVNGLNAVDGQAYTATATSGSAQTGLIGENGTGTLSVGYVESSTTDLTSDLSALIVAQEAYSANTKVVTTADNLLQATIAMKQS
ncbi:flagellar hook-basal body complex protein [Acetobacter sp. TBRC 12305]|uniref:Flagellar hook protein FlgE n=1 Tax=Acetobacter garciniae TaxID=2817435 RepID=A0A939KMJ9_9PROT|nr:flagellar hook-basal body complex protein [Acetobacter garciniae]MBO1324640.1 flagellar hook-basal body complex protein [Acetobacter garciniae]MBX0344329.1 flagellar hook-basal body complex protein [Acetobacter garciniae]